MVVWTVLLLLLFLCCCFTWDLPRVSDTLATVALCTNGFAMGLVGFAMDPGDRWYALGVCCITGVLWVLPGIANINSGPNILSQMEVHVMAADGVLTTSEVVLGGSDKPGP